MVKTTWSLEILWCASFKFYANSFLFINYNALISCLFLGRGGQGGGFGGQGGGYGGQQGNIFCHICHTGGALANKRNYYIANYKTYVLSWL